MSRRFENILRIQQSPAVRLRLNAVRFQENCKLLRAKVRQDQITDNQRRSPTLARDADHLIVGTSIREDIDRTVTVCVTLQPVFSHGTPWTANLDVEFQLSGHHQELFLESTPVKLGPFN